MMRLLNAFVFQKSLLTLISVKCNEHVVPKGSIPKMADEIPKPFELVTGDQSESAQEDALCVTEPCRSAVICRTGNDLVNRRGGYYIHVVWNYSLVTLVYEFEFVIYSSAV